MVQELIFSQLISNDSYARAVLPHLKDEYFDSVEAKNFLKIYTHFFTRHNKIPSKRALLIEVEQLKTSASVYEGLVSIINKQVEFEETLPYLIEKTEKYCREKAIFNALKQSIIIVDGQSKDKTPDAIPSILQEALGVCFDTSVGHDYINDADARYDYYHLTESRVPTGIKEFDDITRNGFPRKTLNVLLAPPHGGKSLVMVNLAAGALVAGYNVLYISMEMAAEEIGKRFDCNLMDVDFDTLECLPKNTFSTKFNKVASTSKGRLIIKEFPTESAHAGHFRSLLEELKTKQNFIPDMVVVDYMSICLSEKHKPSASVNSYTIVKSIGAELRALAIVNNFACITAIQTNKAGVGNSDVDISNTSESFGVPGIADWMGAIINTEDLKQMKQLMLKQLKNRYKNLDEPSKFILGVDYSKMKLYSLDNATIPKFDQKKKSKVETANDTFGIDMLHTIKPSPRTFDDFNFND